jgi:hypothetical protein
MATASLAAAIAFCGQAEGSDDRLVGDFHRRNAPGRIYPTASP